MDMHLSMCVGPTGEWRMSGWVGPQGATAESWTCAF